MIEDHAHVDPSLRVLLHHVLLEELVEHGEDGVRVLGPGLGLADPLGDRAEHLAEPLAIGAGSHPQPVAEVVNEHDVPGAEELGREEVGHRAVRPRLRIVLADKVVDVAVEDEQAGGTCVILLGELSGPAGEPFRNGHGTVSRQRRRGGRRASWQDGRRNWCGHRLGFNTTLHHGSSLLTSTLEKVKPSLRKGRSVNLAPGDMLTFE